MRCEGNAGLFLLDSVLSFNSSSCFQFFSEPLPRTEVFAYRQKSLYPAINYEQTNVDGKTKNACHSW